MRSIAVLGVAAAAAAALITAAPAGADPGMPPCGELSPVCGLLPTMPDLEQDIDLTRQYPQGTGLDQENQPPADVCALGCL